MQLSFSSLFAGGGGLDLGLIQAGLKPRCAFDNDAVAVASYRKNVGNHIYQADLSAPSAEVIEAIRASDILVAGPPCQGFSTVGLNVPNDSRNRLLLRAVEIACEARPSVVLIENVRGLLGDSFVGYTSELRRRLEESGYRTRVEMLNAAHYGVSQNRVRVFIVASLTKVISLPLPLQSRSSLRDVLMDLPLGHTDTAHIFKPGSREDAIAMAIQPGQKLTNVRAGPACIHTWDIPQVFGRTTKMERLVLQGLLVARRTKRVRCNGDADPVSASRLTRELGFRTAPILSSLEEKGFVRRVGALYDLTHTFNGKYRRLTWDDPAPTVDTRFGQPRYFLHPEERRGFSVRETARIQGFPDSYEFPVSNKDAFRLIGNAVPPPLAALIGRHLGMALRSS